MQKSQRHVCDINIIVYIKLKIYNLHRRHYQHLQESDIDVLLHKIYSGMRLGFGKNPGKFYVAIDSNPNKTVGSSYLR